MSKPTQRVDDVSFVLSKDELPVYKHSIRACGGDPETFLHVRRVICPVVHYAELTKYMSVITAEELMREYSGEGGIEAVLEHHDNIMRKFADAVRDSGRKDKAAFFIEEYQDVENPDLFRRIMEQFDHETCAR